MSFSATEKKERKMSIAPLIESIFELDDTNLIAYNRKKTDYIRVAPTTGTSDYANTSGAINFEGWQFLYAITKEKYLHLTC